MESKTFALASGMKAKIYKKDFNVQAVRDLIDRVVFTGFSDHFVFEQIPEKRPGLDAFVLSDDAGKIKISASSANAAAGGFNWYLKYFLKGNVSPVSRHIPVTPDTVLPPIGKAVVQETPFLYRYFLNYCTYSYTMAFWGWEDYEKLIDYMALSGINLALNIVGQETVTHELLLRYGFSEKEISEYICGPAYFAWQWMNNLCGFMGELPLWWYEDRAKLSVRMNTRMRDLGIEVLVPAFCGSVPKSFSQKRPEVSTIAQGIWVAQYDRPDYILPNEPVFSQMAKDYYEIQEQTLGFKPSYFSADPFHEGGNEEGIDKTELTLAVHNAMKEYNPNAVWVFQGWTLNPRREMLSVLPKEHVLITDLVADLYNIAESDDFLHYPYLMCQVNNYGGQRNYRGNFLRSLHNPYNALNNPKAEGMCGIGLLMEGIEDVEIFYDLLGDMAFRPSVPDSKKWIAAYCKRRYGVDKPCLVKALELVTAEVLVCTEAEGTRESVFLARPSLTVSKVSSWTSEKPAYERDAMRTALCLMLEAYDECKGSPSYMFDITDMARQTLADYGWVVVYELIDAYKAGDKQGLAEKSKLFLQMILLQDKLMSAQSQTTLKNWLDKARAMGKTDEEKDLFEGNARTQITVWSDKANEHLLHDYAAKEWGGLLKEFYYKRWDYFINRLKSEESTDDIDWFALESQFISSKEQCDEIFDINVKNSIRDIVRLTEMNV